MSGDPAVPSNHLVDRVTVITGAGSGFGRSMASMTARLGARVVAADVDAASASTIADEIRDAGGAAESFAVDVTSKREMDDLASFAVERFGSLDVLVNNAGVMPLAFFADHEAAWQAWDRAVDINLKGVIHGIAAVYDQMIRQGRGHIVNISSIYGNAGVAGSGVYSATKAAVRVLSDSLRIEAQGKIKVTVVRPTGVIGTGLGGSVVNPAAIVGIVGEHADQYTQRLQAHFAGDLQAHHTDVDDVRYWAITPDELVAEVVHAINQPWGVAINDITVRATGEDFIL
jgi:NADP-dependent 3-hydroxy acid dehydrogenase YdfG